MNSTIQKRYSLGFSIVLALFTFVYAVGVILMLLAWFGVQSLDPLTWQREALPFYALVFLIGAVSAYGIWKRKKWGVYGLAGAWALTGIVNLVFVPPAPMPYKYTFLAALLVIAFFLLLLPEWQRMD